MHSLNRSIAACATSAFNEHIFLSLTEARATIEAWRDDYNHRRPHSSLGALTPVEFAQLRTEKLIPPQEGENNQRLYL
jgi:transposase InsO family protein